MFISTPIITSRHETFLDLIKTARRRRSESPLNSKSVEYVLASSPYNKRDDIPARSSLQIDQTSTTDNLIGFHFGVVIYFGFPPYFPHEAIKEPHHRRNRETRRKIQPNRTTHLNRLALNTLPESHQPCAAFSNRIGDTEISAPAFMEWRVMFISV